MKKNNLAIIIVLLVIVVAAVGYLFMQRNHISYATYNNGIFSFRYDSRVPLSVVEKQGGNSNEPEEIILGIGEKKGIHYEVEVSYSGASGWADVLGLPTNMKSYGRQTFGANQYAVFTDMSAGQKYFQQYKDGQALTFLVAPEETLPKYVDLASVTLADHPGILYGDTADLVSTIITSGQHVSGVQPVAGTLKGGYFFEAQARGMLLDGNKKVIQTFPLHAFDDWMNPSGARFYASVDTSTAPKGPGFIRLANDNSSGDPTKDKHIDIPVIFD